MPINEQIPLSAGPAGAARIDQSVPMNVNSNLPLQVKPFAPIDVMTDTAEAYKLASGIEEFKANQEERIEGQKLKEEKQRDKMLLQQHQQSGGDLFTANGLELAAKELQGKLSPESFDGLLKRIDTKKAQEVNLRSAISKMDDNEFESWNKQQEEATKMLNSAVASYDEVLSETKDPQKAEEAFQSTKQAIIAAAKDMRSPTTGKPFYPEAQLEQLSKMSQKQLSTVINDSKWKSEAIKQEAVARWHNAQADSADALVAKREKETSQLDAKLELATRRVNAAAEKAVKTVVFDPKDAEAAARLISEHKLPPLSGFAMRTPYGQKVMSLVAEYNPGYDAKDYFTQAKAEKDFATGKQGNTVRSFNVAINHLDTLGELGKALKNGDTKKINQLGSFIKTELGLDAAPNNFEAAKKIVGDEIVKAIVGTGGGVTDREEVASKINAANSPELLQGVISTYKELMKGQLGGLETQYEAATGKKDFKTRYLTDKAKSTVGAAENFPTVGRAQQAAADGGRREILQAELQTAQAAVMAAKTPDAKHRAEQDVAAVQRELGGAKAPTKAASRVVPFTNAKGWKLHTDANGNRAYVGPHNEIEEVK